jgi:hypothetical protein
VKKERDFLREAAVFFAKESPLHIPAHHEHPFRTNVNTSSGST